MKKKIREMIEMPIGDLIPYEKNAKRHDEEQVEQIANSIKRFGFVQPVVIDKDNVIVIGHGRVLGAKKAGLETVPCLRAEDLNKKEIKALRLADNKLNESPWDFDLLNEELVDLTEFGMEEFGFDILSEFDEDEEDEPDAKDGKEIDIHEFSDGKFQCKCPRCGFMFNQEG